MNNFSRIASLRRIYSYLNVIMHISIHKIVPSLIKINALINISNLS